MLLVRVGHFHLNGLLVSTFGSFFFFSFSKFIRVASTVAYTNHKVLVTLWSLYSSTGSVRELSRTLEKAHRLGKFYFVSLLIKTSAE